jgi:hypothetical protein
MVAVTSACAEGVAPSKRERQNRGKRIPDTDLFRESSSRLKWLDIEFKQVSPCLRESLKAISSCTNPLPRTVHQSWGVEIVPRTEGALGTQETGSRME